MPAMDHPYSQEFLRIEVLGLLCKLFNLHGLPMAIAFSTLKESEVIEQNLLI